MALYPGNSKGSLSRTNLHAAVTHTDLRPFLRRTPERRIFRPLVSRLLIWSRPIATSIVAPSESAN